MRLKTITDNIALISVTAGEFLQWNGNLIKYNLVQ